MLTLAETEHQEIINKFGGEFEFRIGRSFNKKKNRNRPLYYQFTFEADTEDIDFTNEATIKFAESKETFEINYNEQKGVEGPLKLTGHLVEDSHNNTYDSEAIKKCLMIFDEETNTWSLEMVGSSYHVSKGEFDNFETSSELQEFAKEFDFTMRQSSEDDGMVEEVEYNYNADVDLNNDNDNDNDNDMEVDEDNDNPWMEDYLEVVEPNTIQNIRHLQEDDNDDDDGDDDDGNGGKHGYNNSSDSASSDNSSSGGSSSDNEENDDADNGSDSGDSVLDSEFAELATMMKTSLNQENGVNNSNRTKIKTNNKLNVAANHNSGPVSLEQLLGGGGNNAQEEVDSDDDDDDESGSSS